ncbi:MAG: hypothetical protein ABI239_01930 [Aquihabitans sp.]
MDGASTYVSIDPPPLLTAFERGRERVLRSTPGWKFHLVLALATLPLLWAISSPAGGNFALSMLSVWVLFLGALVWIARLIIWIFGRRSDHPRPSGRVFFIAPLCAVVVVGLFLTNIPLRARWRHAEPTLASIVEGAPPASTDGRPLEFDVPATAGTYGLDRGIRLGDDVYIVLSNKSGGFIGFLEAGFAYLPDRADPVLVNQVTGAESMTFTHLTGDWYTWTSTW